MVEVVRAEVVSSSRGVVQAVAADGILAAVEERVGADIVHGLGPIPIGLIAGVAALVTQGGLVEVEEVPMPTEEDRIEMHAESLVDVDGGEIITAIEGSRNLAGRYDGGLAVEAEDGIDVLLPCC